MRAPDCLRLFAIPVATLIALLPQCAAVAQVPMPQLTSVFPPGARQGTEVELAVAGADLDDGDRLLFTHSGIHATAKWTEPDEFTTSRKPIPGSFRVRVAHDVPPGTYEVRAISRFGISNPRAFVVSAVDESIKTADNSQPDKALEIQVGPIVNARATANVRDYYKINLQAGQRVLIECVAQQIDSRMDATMVVLGPDKKEIVRNRDFRFSDPFIDLTAPVAGTYTISVFDFVYGGGPDYFYRLSVHTRPYVDFVFPPAAQLATTSAITVFGRNLPLGQEDENVRVAGARLQRLTMPVAMPSADSADRLVVNGMVVPRSAFLDTVEIRMAGTLPQLIHVANDPVVVEVEPNNQGSVAQAIKWPCEVVGQFFPARDVDVYQFEAKRGETLVVDVLAHRLGLYCDPLLIIQKVGKNDKGEEVLTDIASVDDPGDRNNRIGTSDFDISTDDPVYRFVAPDDGTYRLSVRDQFDVANSDPRLVYRLAIHPLRPDYRLAVVQQPTLSPPNPQISPLGTSVVRRGGTTTIPILVNRQDDFRGEIELFVDGLPLGVTAPKVVVSAEAAATNVVIAAAESAESWSGPIWIRGVAQVDGKPIVRHARGGAVIWGTANRQGQLPEFRATQSIVLAVCGKDLDAAFVQAGDDKVWETSLGGNIVVPVNLTRRGEYKEAVKLVAVGLPGEIKPGELNLDANTSAVNLTIPINNQNTKPGVYTFYLRSDSKFKHVRNPDAIKSSEDDQQMIAQMLAQLDVRIKEVTAANDAAIKAGEEAANGVKQAEQNKVNLANAAKVAADNAKQLSDKAAAAKDEAGKDANSQALAEAAAAAQKAADEAATAAKTAAEQSAAAEQAFVEAQKKAKAAEDAKVAQQLALKTSQDRLTLVNQKKQEVDKRVNDTKQANQPKDLTFAITSTPIKIRIVPTPLVLSSPTPQVVLKQGTKGEIAFKVERRYEFADQVDLALEPPAGIAGVTATAGMLPNGQSDGKLELTIDKATPVGTHKATLRAKAKFNNVNVDAAQVVEIVVEKSE